MYYIFVLCVYMIEHTSTCTPHTTCILCCNSTLLFISLLSTLLHSLIFSILICPLIHFIILYSFFTEDSTDIALVKSAMATVLQIDVQSKLFIL